jgi:hypothetical protein
MSSFTRSCMKARSKRQFFYIDTLASNWYRGRRLVHNEEKGR